MRRKRVFQPDLADSVLEDRTLAAYDPSLPPLVLTTGGYAVFAVPPGLSAGTGTLGGAAIGGSGGSVGTGYFVTGFGVSAVVIGNPIGFSLGGAAAAGTRVSLNILVGSGANEAQGTLPVTRNVVAQGGGNAAALNMLYIGKQTSTGGYVPGAAGWEPGTPAPLPPAPPPPVPPASPPLPPPVSQTP